MLPWSGCESASELKDLETVLEEKKSLSISEIAGPWHRLQLIKYRFESVVGIKWGGQEYRAMGKRHLYS